MQTTGSNPNTKDTVSRTHSSLGQQELQTWQVHHPGPTHAANVSTAATSTPPTAMSKLQRYLSQLFLCC
jgi:hypothetical protein